MQFAVGDILRDVLLVGAYDAALFLIHFAQIVCVEIFLDGSRHPSYNEIQLYGLQHPLMDEIVDRSFLVETLMQVVDNLITYPDGLKKLKKVERIHLNLVHVAHGHATQVVKFHTQQRAAHDVLVASFVHKEFDSSHYFLAFLHLVEEYQRLSRHQLLSGKG